MGVLVADAGRVRDAAWIARCVGRQDATPLRVEDIDALASKLEHQRFEPGEPVYRSGEPSRGVWIVRSGLLALTVGAGPRRVIVQLLRIGDVDGDLQLLLGMPMSYDARASTPTECFFLPAERFQSLLTTHPAVSLRWLTSIAGRLASSQHRLVDLLGRPMPTQLARLLLDEAVDGETPLAQSTLAAMLGVQRPSVNRVLKDWEREGLVETSYRRVRILDPRRLARLAQ